MAKVSATLSKTRSVYARDFFAWTQQQAERLRRAGPSAGSSAISVRAVTAPIPGTEASRSSVACHTGEPRMVSSRSRSILASAWCSQRKVGVEVALQLGIPGLTAAVALGADHLDDLAPAAVRPARLPDTVSNPSLRDSMNIGGCCLENPHGYLMFSTCFPSHDSHVKCDSTYTGSLSWTSCFSTAFHSRINS
jgi:hypothetical protein